MTQRVLIIREVDNEAQTRTFAAEALSFFRRNDTVLLYGDLGSGKTFLVKEFVRLLGSRQEASSPSFTILNHYAAKIPVNHIDLYRITDMREIRNLGLDDLWDSGYINFVEWPELIEKTVDWPHFRITIEMQIANGSWRKFNLSRYEN